MLDVTARYTTVHWNSINAFNQISTFKIENIEEAYLLYTKKINDPDVVYAYIEIEQIIDSHTNAKDENTIILLHSNIKSK